MAYIGNIPAEKFTSVDIQNFTVSATANYTLDRPVANENEIELFINNVRQHPGSGKAYTASGTALTLSEATAGTDTMYCVYQGKARQTVTPATSSVTNAMLAGSIDLTSKVTGALPQANIADQAINEAKMQISNAPTNGYMLTAQSGNTGGLTWAEAPSGTLVEVAQSNISAGSSVSAVEFSNIFSSSYHTYFVRMGKIRFAGDTSLQMRFYSDTGTTEFSGAYYYYSRYGLNNLGSREDNTGNGADRLYITATLDYDQPADGGATGYFYIQDPLANSSFSTNVTGQFTYRDNGNVWNGINFGGKYGGSSARYGFKLYGSSNVEYADITVYGVKP